MTKYLLLGKYPKTSENLKYNEFPETFLKLHTIGYLYPKYFDGLSLVPKFEFLKVKLLDYLGPDEMSAIRRCSLTGVP